MAHGHANSNKTISRTAEFTVKTPGGDQERRERAAGRYREVKQTKTPEFRGPDGGDDLVSAAGCAVCAGVTLAACDCDSRKRAEAASGQSAGVVN